MPRVESPDRSGIRVSAAAAVGLLVWAGTPAATPATGVPAPPTPALNGTYQAVSIGDWAKIDDVYRPLPTVVQTWTIESSCSDPQTCDGQVVSDAGWSADIHFQTQTWTLRRTLEHWQPCPDDTVYPGHQLYRFYPMTGGTYVVGDSVLAGDDTTTGEPGACGVGYPTVITLPFRLVRLS